MRLLVVGLCVISCAGGGAEYEKELHFFCDYLGVPDLDKGNHSNESFNRMFSYRQFSDGHYQLRFNGDWVLAQSQKDFLYRVQSSSEGHFEIHRFNIKTFVLTHSFVYHLSTKQYQKDLEERKTNPYLIPYSDKPLDFVTDPVPAHHKKVGFDKSHWQCQGVKGMKYVLKKYGVLLMQMLSSG